MTGGPTSASAGSPLGRRSFIPGTPRFVRFISLLSGTFDDASGPLESGAVQCDCCGSSGGGNDNRHFRSRHYRLRRGKEGALVRGIPHPFPTMVASDGDRQ